MGKNDVAVKRWLSSKERFADLFNAVLFEGRQIILPKDLENMESESNVLLADKKKNQKSVQRYRDIVMRWNRGLDFVILASENQDKVHYAMPVRNMVYDGLVYTEQIDRIWKKHKKNKDKMTAEEFLSHFKKEDSLKPVLTLVFYYGTKPWDGSLDLHGMLESRMNSREEKILKKFIPNYYINLIDAERIPDLKAFHTDLQVIFGMLQYRNKKDEFVKYVSQNEKYFSRLDRDTYQAVQVFLSSEKKLYNIISIENEKEEINMCKALDDLFAEGIEKGIAEGIEKRDRDLIIKKHIKGIPAEVIAEFLEVPVEMVNKVIDQAA